ncbi:MAG TPA: hypothetical protein VI564_05130 [Candidatus Nanoarchaeia archaeon]|nr:hypothetical protein [Candidatus Nanoarchaeia archaeon]
MKEETKEKVLGATGSLSGAASIMGSWQICHSICLGIIALLSVVGITITGMPLLFLTSIRTPLWMIAVVLLMATIVLYQMKKCISRNLIIFNSGLIFAGIPFQNLQTFSIYFWVIGGAISLTAVVLYLKDRKKAKRCEHEK